MLQIPEPFLATNVVGRSVRRRSVHAVTFVHGLCAATTVASLLLPSGAAAAALGEPVVIPLSGNYCRHAAVEPLPIPPHMSPAHEPERAELNHIETTVDAFDLSNASPVVTGAGASQVPPDVWHPYVQSFESFGSVLRQQGRAHEAVFGLKQLALAGGKLRTVWQVRDHVASEKGTVPADVLHAPVAKMLIREQRCEMRGTPVTIVSSEPRTEARPPCETGRPTLPAVHRDGPSSTRLMNVRTFTASHSST